MAKILSKCPYNGHSSC